MMMVMQGEGAEATATAGGGGGEGEGQLKKGPWTAAEDEILSEYVRLRGEGNWNAVRRNTPLLRCGKSCRLRWVNHLRPDLKKGSFSPEEESIIARLHAQLGNKWALMASQLPGRTDNEIKNYWNTRVKRQRRAGLPLYPPEMQPFFSSRPSQPAARQRLAMPPLVVEPLFAFSAPASPILPGSSNNNLLVPPLSVSQFASTPASPSTPTAPLLVPPLSQFAFPLSTPASPSTPTAPLFPPPRPLPLLAELPSNQLVPAGALAAAAAAADANMVDAMVEELCGEGELKMRAFVAEAGAPPTFPLLGNENGTQCSYISPYHFGGGCFGSGGFNVPTVIDVKSEPQCAIENDVNQLLGVIPASSSVIVDGELGLAMQLEPGPLITEENWNIGACTWNNMPGIC